MKLLKDTKGYYWMEGSATSQSFPTRAAAERAAEEEKKEMIRLGLDPESNASAGILEWVN